MAIASEKGFWFEQIAFHVWHLVGECICTLSETDETLKKTYVACVVKRRKNVFELNSCNFLLCMCVVFVMQQCVFGVKLNIMFVNSVALT